ncbi:MAG: PTS sugar transporter subunit IIA [Spirochaetales bacterium]|nr:PTS sugar transporter subunit IIA [Spirochaetales bacterium]
MTIKSILKKETVLMLEETTKESALERMIKCAFETGDVDSEENLKKNIFYREELMSTGMGLGIAIPHTRYEGISAPKMIIGIQPQGISDYVTLDDHKIQFVVMILVGKDQHKTHIQMMSQIVSLLKEDSLRNKLLNATSSDEIFETLMETK